jgi:mRNA interferase HicA
MNGKQLVRIVKKLGRENGIDVRFAQHRGKGSHGTLYYGDRYVVLPDRKKDIGAGLMSHISRQLGIPRGQLK